MSVKKGQAALEYLVTYGWAILAVVVIAAIIWYTMLQPPSIAGHAVFSTFRYLDGVVDSTSGLKLVLGNLGAMSVTQLMVGTDSNALISLDDSTYQNPGSGVGEDGEFSVPGQTKIFIKSASTVCTPGQPYSYEVVVDYYSVSGYPKTEKGTVKGACPS
ncbi:hypothetical protein HY991_02995 [Candidatus Micrarchaeota archaeon]|nr:hypothetical protein [Candidatus Micrarchaeota archaeon]